MKLLKIISILAMFVFMNLSCSKPMSEGLSSKRNHVTGLSPEQSSLLENQNVTTEFKTVIHPTIISEKMYSRTDTALVYLYSDLH